MDTEILHANLRIEKRPKPEFPSIRFPNYTAYRNGTGVTIPQTKKSRCFTKFFSLAARAVTKNDACGLSDSRLDIYGFKDSISPSRSCFFSGD